MRGNSLLASSLPIVAFVAGLALWGFSVRDPVARNAGDLGLVTVLGPLWWVGIGLVALGFVLEVSNLRPRGTVLCLGVVLIACALHGTAAVLEEAPRYQTAWLHAGFTDYIARNGQTAPQLDARMSWPGFFSGAAMASRAMGVEPTWFLFWAPVIQNLALLVPLKAFANGQLFTVRARWLTLWLFVCANWVGQDYFAPQAFNFFLLLSALVVVTRIFGVREQPFGRPYIHSNLATRLVSRATTWLFRGPAWSRPIELGPVELSPASSLGWLVALTVMVAATIVSHQLTPVALIVCLAALVASGRTRLRASVVLFGVMLLAWISWGTVPYWRGHFDTIFGGFGQVQSSVGQNVGSRLQGSPGRLWVVRARIAVAALVWLAGALALLGRWRRGFQHYALLSLAVAPFGIMAVQSYGGEAILRIYLFTLPACVMLIAAYLAERHPDTARLKLAGRLTVVALLLIGLFPFARWGNERYEQVTDAEVETIEWVYENVPQGSRLVATYWTTPWRYRHLLDYRYREIGGLRYVDAESEATVFDVADENSWIILTRAQELYGTNQFGLADGWTQQVVRILVSSGRFREVFRNEDGVVLCGTVGSCLASEVTAR